MTTAATIKNAQQLDGMDLSEDRLAAILGDDFEDINDLRIDDDSIDIQEILNPTEVSEDGDEVILNSELLNQTSPNENGMMVVTLDDKDLPAKKQFDFSLSSLPGAEEAEEFVEEEQEDESLTFLREIEERLKSVPSHNGQDTLGIRRAINYLEKLESDIDDKVKNDIEGKLTREQIAMLEEAKRSILGGIDGLEERLNKINSKNNKDGNKSKRKKKSSSDILEGIVKQAQRIHGITHGTTVTVPLIIDGAARTCINASVSAGRDIEDVFQKVSKQYDFSTREKNELRQLLDDYGYPVRMDRGFSVGEEVDPASVDNVEWSQQFTA